MRKPEKEISDYLRDLEARSVNVFMCGSQEEDKRYTLHNKDRYINVIKELDRILRKMKKPVKILDIGTSPLTFMLKKRYPHAQIFSVDYTSRLSALCGKFGVKFKQVDLNRRNFKLPSHKFNIVLFLEVIEHLSGDHAHIMKNILCYMESDSYCIIQTPNKNSLKSFVTRLLSMDRVDNVSKRPNLSHEFEHVKEYSFDELKKFVKSFLEVDLLKAEHSLYFDTVDSSVVYRKYSVIIIPILFLFYITVGMIPPLRSGLLFVVQKRT